jgi:hypothetical protein
MLGLGINFKSNRKKKKKKKKKSGKRIRGELVWTCSAIRKKRPDPLQKISIFCQSSECHA